MRERLFKMKYKVSHLENNYIDSSRERLRLENAKSEYNRNLSHLGNMIMTDIKDGNAEGYRMKIQLLLDLSKV